MIARNQPDRSARPVKMRARIVAGEHRRLDPSSASWVEKAATSRAQSKSARKTKNPGASGATGFRITIGDGFEIPALFRQGDVLGGGGTGRLGGTGGRALLALAGFFAVVPSFLAGLRRLRLAGASPARRWSRRRNRVPEPFPNQEPDCGSACAVCGRLCRARTWPFLGALVVAQVLAGLDDGGVIFSSWQPWIRWTPRPMMSW